MNRRDLLKGSLAAGVLRALSRAPQSDPDVPPHIDIALGDHAGIPVKIFVDGVEQLHVLAYHLPEQWARVLWLDPNGEPILVAESLRERVLRGHVVVQWDRKLLAERAATTRPPRSLRPLPPQPTDEQFWIEVKGLPGEPSRRVPVPASDLHYYQRPRPDIRESPLFGLADVHVAPWSGITDPRSPDVWGTRWCPLPVQTTTMKISGSPRRGLRYAKDDMARTADRWLAQAKAWLNTSLG